MRLPGYETLGELGRGGQGAVYRVRDLATGAERALKVLEGALDPETLARFRREAETLARLEGRGVVPVHHAGVAGGRLYFVMDVMPGGSLRDLLETGRRLEWREAAVLVAKLARALERAHALGIVHRDLKPANVLFDDAREPRLADFGCARDLQAASLTETGAILGTPAYMAPEQLEGRKVGPGADVFALGAVLHELLTGERPFEGSTPVRIFQAMKAGGRRRASEKASSPRALDAILDGALELDPMKRASAGELAAALEGLVQGKGEAPDKTTRLSLAPLVLGLVALGCVGLAGAAFVLGTGPARDTAPGPSPRPTSRPRPTPSTPLVRETAKPAQRDEAEKCYLHAVESQRHGKAGQAYDEVREALKLDPDLATAHALLVELAIGRAENDLAYTSAKRALELDPTLFPKDLRAEAEVSLETLAQAVRAQDPVARELGEVRVAAWRIALDPKDARAWCLRARNELEGRVPDVDQAARDAATSLALEPTNPDTAVLVALVMEHRGQARKAIRQALDAEALAARASPSPGPSRIFGPALCPELLARLYEHGDEIVAAIDALTRALAFGAVRADLTARRAFLEARLGRLEKAEADVARASFDGSPSDEWYLDLARAELVAARGDLPSTIERLAKLSEAHPEDPGIVTALVQHLRERHGPGDLERALAICHDLCRRHAGLANSFRLRASVEFDLDPASSHLAAERDLSTALEMDPEFVEAWHDRASLRAGRNDLAGARNDLKRAIELTPPGETRTRLEGELERIR